MSTVYVTANVGHEGGVFDTHYMKQESDKDFNQRVILRQVLSTGFLVTLEDDQYNTPSPVLFCDRLYGTEDRTSYEPAAPLPESTR